MEALRESDEQVRDETAREHDPRWLLAKRIAKSNTFTRSDRLSKLLLYVSRMHIAGRDGEINEQRIGTEVFRRAPSYDSGADSIVRSHATRLRQRLDLYFTTEGSDELLRLEIPRGGYVPHFFALGDESRSEKVFAEATPNLLESEISGHAVEVLSETEPARTLGRAELKRRHWVKPFGAGLILALLLALLSWHLRQDAALQMQKSRISGQTKVEKQFWDGLLNEDDRTLVVTGDSGLVLYETFAKREVSLPDYILGTYHEPHPGTTPENQLYEKDFAARRYTSVADLNLAVRLSHLPQWREERAQAIFARDLRLPEASKSNLILIGSRQANPWVSLIDGSMNFILTPDGAGHFYFVNRHPTQNERPTYIPSQPGSDTTDSSVYALICYRPNSPSLGKILLLSGLWMSGTEAAGNFVLDHHQFAEFLSTIARPDGSIPPFELLVQIRSLAGNAVNSTIIARRIG